MQIIRYELKIKTKISLKYHTSQMQTQIATYNMHNCVTT